MNNVKKIGKSGGFTIPANLRRDLGIQGGEKVDIKVNNDGSILLQRIGGTCIICSGYGEGLKNIGKKFICMDCIDRVKRL